MSNIFSIFKEKNIMENFKQIPGFENYGISPAGEVKNLKTGKILKNVINQRGYYKVDICNNKKYKTFKIHQLVAMMYLNHTPDGTQKIVVDHINNDKLDNRVQNLQLISNRENRVRSITRELPTGVYAYRRKYRSKIYINNKNCYLGIFDTIEEASNAYQQKLQTI
jgi:hypothetical protein